MINTGGQVADKVRRRVQQNTLGHSGRAGDPLYGIRPPVHIGAEHLTAKQITRLNIKCRPGNPHQKVTLPWHCCQKLRVVYHAHTQQRRHLVVEMLGAFLPCPNPGIARLGRTLQRWKPAIMVGFDTDGASN